MSLAQQVDAVILGEERAKNFLTTLRCILGDGDELFRAVAKCPPDQLQPFLREIQKQLEGRMRIGSAPG